MLRFLCAYYVGFSFNRLLSIPYTFDEIKGISLDFSDMNNFKIQTFDDDRKRLDFIDEEKFERLILSDLNLLDYGTDKFSEIYCLMSDFEVNGVFARYRLTKSTIEVSQNIFNIRPYFFECKKSLFMHTSYRVPNLFLDFNIGEDTIIHGECRYNSNGVLTFVKWNYDTNEISFSRSNTNDFTIKNVDDLSLNDTKFINIIKSNEEVKKKLEEVLGATRISKLLMLSSDK